MDSRSNKQKLLRLYPQPARERPLRRTYLSEPLRPAGSSSKPFVYASFVVSLDGRISLPDSETKTRKVPRAITNSRDWRLFQELAAPADMLLTSGRYIRDLADGVAQDSLPVSKQPEFSDLLEWRNSHNLSSQPAVTIVTDTLDLSIPEELLQSGRPIYMATGEAADTDRVKRLQAQGVHLLKTGRGTRVEGRRLIAALAQEGFGNIFMTAGAILLNTLLADGVFDRLYLTQACRILGGKSFDTLVKGQQFEPPSDFELRSLYYDAARDNNIEQLFTVLDYRK